MMVSSISPFRELVTALSVHHVHQRQAARVTPYVVGQQPNQTFSLHMLSVSPGSGYRSQSSFRILVATSRFRAVVSSYDQPSTILRFFPARFKADPTRVRRHLGSHASRPRCKVNMVRMMRSFPRIPVLGVNDACRGYQTNLVLFSDTRTSSSQPGWSA